MIVFISWKKSLQFFCEICFETGCCWILPGWKRAFNVDTSANKRNRFASSHYAEGINAARGTRRLACPTLERVSNLNFPLNQNTKCRQLGVCAQKKYTNSRQYTTQTLYLSPFRCKTGWGGRERSVGSPILFAYMPVEGAIRRNLSRNNVNFQTP